jgi:hypothetical protein
MQRKNILNPNGDLCHLGKSANDPQSLPGHAARFGGLGTAGATPVSVSIPGARRPRGGELPGRRSAPSSTVYRFAHRGSEGGQSQGNHTAPGEMPPAAHHVKGGVR